MEKQSLISIVIPIYNAEKYLEECIDSIRNQTYKNLDIILVDDGSKDHSPKICDDYAKQDSRVRVLHKKNGGLVSAWTAGAEMSKGEYLMFIDSDDWLDLSAIEEMAQYITGGVKEIICSNYVIEKKNKSIFVKQSMKPGVYVKQDVIKKIHTQLMGEEVRRIHCSRCMKLFSKSLILENIKYSRKEIRMGEDLNITFPAILDADRIVIMEDGYFYHYRLVDTSMVHKYDSKLYANNKLLYKTLIDILDSKWKEGSIENKEILLKGLQKEYVFLLFFVLKNELRGPWKGCVKRIQDIIKEARQESEIHKLNVEVNNKANKLLYFIMKTPNIYSITLGKTAIEIFDRL